MPDRQISGESIMKKGMYFLLSTIIMLMSSGAVLAQDYDYHPELSDNFSVSLGAFRSDHGFKISSTGSDEDDDGERIDFDDSLGVSKSATLVNAQLRWKFGKNRKWSLWGQYFQNDASGEATLTEDVPWQGIIFREGTFVGAGVDFAVTRVFIGRSFVKNQQHDFGIGLGLHNLDMAVYIEGDISIDDETTEFFRGDADKSQPLPNIGTWYNFSPARKWLIHGRVDWISADIGDYDGTLWNTNIGVNYQAFRHVGFDLSYQYFNLNLGVKDSDWRGEIDMTYSGPVLSVTGNW
jgi:hypothetical protein